MISLTRKADYALVAMAELACRAPEVLSSAEIARRTSVPARMLANILHRLVQQGLVQSTSGARGGYQLARSAEEISLADILDVVDGPRRLTWCCHEQDRPDEHQCDLEDTCRIKGPVQLVHHTLRQLLGRYSLAQVAFNFVPLEMGSSIGGNGASGRTTSITKGKA